jgi:2-haloacid dehalogenase
MSAPDWLADIQLITFDCFGTLIDWRSHMAPVEIESDADFAAFVEHCREIEGGDRHMPYAAVVKTAIAKLRPALRPSVIGLFADDLGRLPAFRDAPGALGAMQSMARVGVLANSDPSHQLDVMSTLRVAWDVVITSAEVRAFKPSARAWDAIVRMAIARAAVPRDAWLHVSALDRVDLEPARARGLRTVHVRRPGGDTKAPADLTVDGLDELALLVAEAKGGPIVLEVVIAVEDPARRADVRRWLVSEHLPNVRTISGVRGARLLEHDDGHLVEQLVFGGLRELEAYEEGFAAEHRAAFREACGRDLERTSRRALLRGRG